MPAYYATARSAKGAHLLAGPFQHHDEALDASEDCRLLRLGPLGDHWWTTYGTARVPDRSYVGTFGQLNDRLGLRTDVFGFVHGDGRRARKRFARQQAARPGSAAELAFKANRAHCRWCGSEVPRKARNLNPNDSTGSFCPSDGIRPGCREDYYS